MAEADLALRPRRGVASPAASWPPGPLARETASATLDPGDVAPTVLAVLGVPAARDVAGKVRADLLAPGAATSETVATWGRRRAGAPPSVDPKEYVENLRSLGYLR